MDDKRNSLLASLLLLALTWWMCLPEHRRREYRMRTALATQKTVQSMARRIAGRSMLAELDGREDTAQGGYELAYRLMSEPFERARQAYEKLRSVS